MDYAYCPGDILVRINFNPYEIGGFSSFFMETKWFVCLALTGFGILDEEATKQCG